MKTNESTTFILLERGIEDVELLNELDAIMNPTTIEKAKKYPRLQELRIGLRKEVRSS